ELEGRVYVLLPDLAGEQKDRRGVERSVLALTRKTVSAARATLGLRVHAAVDSLVERLGDVSESRSEADRILDAIHRSPYGVSDRELATTSDVRTRVLVSESLGYLRTVPSLRYLRVGRLRGYDRNACTFLVRSLLSYLEVFCNARAAAERLHIHPNTLRYRIRRAASISGLDLHDPEERLFTQLQLLMEQQPPHRS